MRGFGLSLVGEVSTVLPVLHGPAAGRFGVRPVEARNHRFLTGRRWLILRFPGRSAQNDILSRPMGRVGTGNADRSSQFVGQQLLVNEYFEFVVDEATSPGSASGETMRAGGSGLVASSTTMP